MTRKKADSATDGRRVIKVSVWAFAWKQELMPIAEFIEATESNKSVDPDFQRKLARALREFFVHSDADEATRSFTARLGIRGRQGKRKPTAEETETAFLAVVDMVKRERQLLSEGQKNQAARAAAIAEISKRDRIPKRTAYSWRDEHSEAANFLIDAVMLRKRKRRQNPA